MKMKNLEKTLLAAVLPAAMMLSAPVQAQGTWFTIDDFNVNTSSSIEDKTNDGNKEGPESSTIDGTNIVADGTEGWSRTLYAEMTTGPTEANGDSVETEVCSNCAAGHYSSAAGTAGYGEWMYSGPVWDVSGNPGHDDEWWITFDYAADHDGGIVSFSFTDEAGNNETFSSVSLSNTGSSSIDNLRPEHIDWTMGGGVDYTQITGINVRVDGRQVEDLDVSIDNLMLHHVPEPATIALVGLGLAGLGWKKRRAAAA